MDKMGAKDRWRRARVAGGGTLDRDSWRGLVERAAERGRAMMPSITVGAAMPALADLPKYEVCPRDCIPVRYQTILDVECALADAERYVEELDELGADHEIALAVRDRLRATLTKVREKIRLDQQRSHLKLV